MKKKNPVNIESVVKERGAGALFIDFPLCEVRRGRETLPESEERRDFYSQLGGLSGKKRGFFLFLTKKKKRLFQLSWEREGSTTPEKREGKSLITVYPGEIVRGIGGGKKAYFSEEGSISYPAAMGGGEKGFYSEEKIKVKALSQMKKRGGAKNLSRERSFSTIQ